MTSCVLTDVEHTLHFRLGGGFFLALRTLQSCPLWAYRTSRVNICPLLMMYAGSQGYLCNVVQNPRIILKYWDILTYYFTALTARPHFFQQQMETVPPPVIRQTNPDELCFKSGLKQEKSNTDLGVVGFFFSNSALIFFTFAIMLLNQNLILVIRTYCYFQINKPIQDFIIQHDRFPK